jgi:hypothetical protein
MDVPECELQLAKDVIIFPAAKNFCFYPGEVVLDLVNTTKRKV